MSMKKIIAMTLALAMALSMVAFAGYTDADKINEDLSASVDLVGALGIMQGNADGSFNPQGTLTRGEAATIIYRLSSGSKTIDASWADASLNKFSDMAGHWSAPYVNYCAALGLIAGYEDGTFRPEKAVTAVEMAKMLLNVAGYDTVKQGYGKNWPMAVLADAAKAGLFVDYTAAFTGEASREWVAKMLNNMIDEVETVYYDYGDFLKTNGMFGDKYGVAKYVGVLTATSTNGLGEAKVADKTATVGGKTVKTNVAEALLGHEVTVYYKEDKVAGFDGSEKIYAVMDAADKVINTTLDKITYSGTNLTIAGTKYEDVKTSGKPGEDVILTTYQNLTKVSNPGKTAANNGRAVTAIYNDSAKTWNLLYNAVEYAKVDEHKADNNQFQAGKIDFKGGSKEANKDEYAQINFAGPVAKGDFVAIETVGKDTVTYNVSKLNATRTKISAKSENTLTIAGTVYEANDVYMEAGFEDYATFYGKLDKKTLAKTYDVYIDGGYVVYAALYDPNAGKEDVKTVNTEVALVLAAQAGVDKTTFDAGTPDKVQVVLNNGDAQIYEYKVDKDDKKAVAFDTLIEAAAKKGTLNATYTEKVMEIVYNEDGTVYFCTPATDAKNNIHVVTDKAANGYKANANVADSFLTFAAGDNVPNLFADENAFFFVKRVYKNSKSEDVTEYSVLKAAEIAKDAKFDAYTFAINGKQTVAYSYNKDTGMNTLAYGVLSAGVKDLPAPESKPIAKEFFITTEVGKAVTTEAGTTWTVEGITAAGVADKITVTKDGDKIAANTIYVIETKGDDTYLAKYLEYKGDNTGSLKVASANSLDTAKNGWYQGAIKATDGKTFIIADDKSGAKLDLAADLVLINVQLKDSKVSLIEKDLVMTGAYNVWFQLDENGDVCTVIVGYVNDKIDEVWNTGLTYKIA